MNPHTLTSVPMVWATAMPVPLPYRQYTLLSEYGIKACSSEVNDAGVPTEKLAKFASFATRDVLRRCSIKIMVQPAVGMPEDDASNLAAKADVFAVGVSSDLPAGPGGLKKSPEDGTMFSRVSVSCLPEKFQA